MRDWAALRERYMQDDVPVRLGNLASNLKRIQSFVANPALCEAAHRIVRESTYYIEWTALDLDVDTCAELVELQVQLAGWHLHWRAIWNDPQRRSAVAEQTGAWSDRVLHLSGLMKREEIA